jgi:hypothetical protein
MTVSNIDAYRCNTPYPGLPAVVKIRLPRPVSSARSNSGKQLSVRWKYVEI